MKKLFFLIVSLAVFTCAHSQETKKISEMIEYNGNPNGGYVPVIISGNNYKVDPIRFGALKINIADSAAMLLPYYRSAQAAVAFALKLGISDTSAMLSPYYRTAAATAALALKLNLSDSAAMLSPYYRSAAASAALALKINIADSAAMLLPYYRSAAATVAFALKLGMADTSAMLSPYLRSALAAATYATKSALVDTAAAIREDMGGGIGVSDGDKGDVVVSSSGTSWTVPVLDKSVVGLDLVENYPSIVLENADTAVGSNIIYFPPGDTVAQGRKFKVHGTGVDTSASTNKVFDLEITGVSDFSDIGGVWSDNASLAGAINAKQDVLIPGTNWKTINGNDPSGPGDLVVTGSPNYPAQILALQALGSTVKAETINFPASVCNTALNLTDGQIRYTAVYLEKAVTLTGVQVIMRTAGSYTGDNNNVAGLYTYSGGTLTRVAQSTNSATLWTASANTILSIPFSSTYAASEGLYFVAILYNNSAQTTAPQIASGTPANNGIQINVGFTNSARLHATINSQTSLPSSQAMSAMTQSAAPAWVALY